VAYKHRNPKSNIISTNNRNKKQAKKKIWQVHGSWNKTLKPLIKLEREEREENRVLCK
jgi:hypothetical protein